MVGGTLSAAAFREIALSYFVCLLHLRQSMGPFSLSHSSFPSPSLSTRSPDMTELLLTGTLSFNSINQLLLSCTCHEKSMQTAMIQTSLYIPTV